MEGATGEVRHGDQGLEEIPSDHGLRRERRFAVPPARCQPWGHRSPRVLLDDGFVLLGSGLDPQSFP